MGGFLPVCSRVATRGGGHATSGRVGPMPAWQLWSRERGIAPLRSSRGNATAADVGNK
jgi:hypothetical protein